MQKDQEIPKSGFNFNSELAFQSFFDSAPMMIGIAEVVGDDIRHVSDNQAAARFFGREANEISGHMASELGMPKEVIADWIEKYLEAENTGRPVNFDYQHDSQDFSVTVSFMGRNHEDLPRFSYIVQDVSAAVKRARNDLKLSEEKFRLILENMSEGLMMFDEQKNLIFQNPASVKIHGLKSVDEKIKSQKLLESWNAWDLAGNPITSDAWPVSRVFRGERFQDQILKFKGLENGKEFIGSYNGCPIYDQNGNLSYGFITIRDISGEIETRQILEENEIRFREIANTLPQIIWTARPDGYVDWYNDWWFKYLEVPRGTLWDDPKKLPMHPEDAEKVWPIWEEALSSGNTFIMEQRFKRGSDGQYRWHLVRAVPTFDRNGEIIKWIGSNTDIHDHKLLLEELENERDLREKFVAALSHDLRTPLTAAKMTAQLLSRRVNNEKFIHRASVKIADSMDRADSMIQDMLDASRINAGEKLPLELKSCDLNKLVIETIEDLSTVHGARFQMKLEDEITAQLSCNAIRRIIENLCQNAIKYGSQLSPVTITLKQENETILLSVHNQGPAIPEEDQRILFEAYRRADSIQVKTQKGWGLGLTLVKGLAEAHGGNVFVSSSIDNGTTFTVKLPQKN